METTIEVKIYMKNGQKIVVYLKKISVQKEKASGVLTSGVLISKLLWENESLDLPGIFIVDVDEIIAITTKKVKMDDITI